MFKSASLRILPVSLILSLIVSSGNSLAAEKCEYALTEGGAPALVRVKLGIDYDAKAKDPLSLRVVKSDVKWLENTINGVGDYILGKALNIKTFNEIIKEFVADKSADPYFVRLARAFKLQVKVDEAAVAKAIPKTGPAIIVSNHPKNGSDGIALAAAVSKVRPDTKIALTLLLESVPGMSEEAIFLNPYGGPEARAYNKERIKQMEEHLLAGGVLVIFAAGDVSVKAPGSKELPADLEWKTGIASMVQKVPTVQVIPTYVGGEASNAFYRVKNWGIGVITTVFHVRELFNNIGHDFPISFSPPLQGTELLAQFGNSMKEMMRYIRARAYILAENQKTADVRQYQDLIPSKDPHTIYRDAVGFGQLMYSNKGIEVISIAGSAMTENLWHELGRVREKSFRSVGEGTGKSMDIDKYDVYYNHMIAFDAETHNILGAYRIGRVDNIMDTFGVQGVYTSNFFRHEVMLAERGAHTLELGRSFADFTAGSKAIRALDSIWKGIAQFMIQNPHYRYLIGPVSISNAYSPASKYLIINYLRRQIDPTLSRGVFGKTPIKIDVQFAEEIELVASRVKDLKELNQLVTAIDGIGIPPLLFSYEKLGAKYIAFDFDKDFNTIDGLILVDILSPEAANEAKKHFGDKWERYADFAKSLTARP